jgi:hypothetical protein
MFKNLSETDTKMYIVPTNALPHIMLSRIKKGVECVANQYPKQEVEIVQAQYIAQSATKRRCLLGSYQNAHARSAE